MKQSRYFITKPVPGGYAYYDVRDREGLDGKDPNFSLMTVYKDAPEAEDVCMRYLSTLQAQEN